MVRPREKCSACGFDSDLYNRNDTVTSQRALARVLEAAAEGLSDDVLSARPNDSTWSIAEYTDHVREVVFSNRFAIELALGEPGIDLGDPHSTDIGDQLRTMDYPGALAGVHAEYAAMRELLAGLSDEQWDCPVTLSGEELTVGWFARHVLHDGLHHMADIGRIRHRFGHGAQTEHGVVAQLNVSNGGVPKQAVSAAAISPAGVDGDAQADREHHGRPVQAVCLWSADVIGDLQSQGHPISPGNAGENVTVAGIDWAGLRPGSRVDIGTVPMLVSAHAVPCAKNAQWFSDRDFNRILHDTNPGFSRLYAIPLANGRVSVGDVVTVEPVLP